MYEQEAMTNLRKNFDQAVKKMGDLIDSTDTAHIKEQKDRYDELRKEAATYDKKLQKLEQEIQEMPEPIVEKKSLTRLNLLKILDLKKD